MKYSVIWVRTAEDRLTNIWLSSRFRDSITRAAKAIDGELEFRPLEVGESRDLNRRILIEAPLGVLYRVYGDRQSVHVLRVWEIAGRKF